MARFAVGAWIGVERTGKPTLWRRVRTDGSYLSASDTRVHFGLGASPAITALVIRVARRPARAADRCRRRYARHTAQISIAFTSSLIGSLPWVGEYSWETKPVKPRSAIAFMMKR